MLFSATVAAAAELPAICGQKRLTQSFSLHWITKLDHSWAILGKKGVS